MSWTMNVGALSLGILDIVILVVLIAGAVVCCLRGFISEFSHWAGLIAAYFLGIMFTRPLSNVVVKAFPSLPLFLPALLSFMFLALIGYIALYILGSMLDKVADAFYLSYLNNILGFVWGLCVASFILGFILWILNYQSIIDFTPLFEHSIMYTKIFAKVMRGVGSVINGVKNI